MKGERLNKFWWLYAPLLLMALQISIRLFLPEQIRVNIDSEAGPQETLQFLVLIAGFLIALAALARIDWKTQKYLGLWLALSALCCFYVAGEEISWGQWLFHWTTPEYWTQVNDQNETNLHNTSSWLDQKPRLLLQLGILTGGIIIPLLRRFKPAWLPARFTIIYPPSFLFVTAFLALCVNISDRFDSAIDSIDLFTRASEVEELFMFWFVMVYLLVMRRRVLQHQR